MRSEDDKVHPEAVQRIKDERSAKRWGIGLMAFGAFVVGLPILRTGDISTVAALAGIAIMLCGGLVRDPQTFRAVTRWGIAALPGGKE